ncbi:hypothetical protein [Streptomyces sp. SID10815]|uniref:hypothetical protein n=1 Tax=Streptomyces sp. SID10815 TaxID=2706027 RepID=UPI0013CA0E4A|nr:hypothetical protein [Streptomyces sp. SID10815]NEA46023.1 hypothetical protein [Streptomyces sp. SID10815]
MTANPLTVPEPATVGSAAALKQQLDDALRAAAFTAMLASADDETALNLTLYGSSCPFDDSVEAATAWLGRVGVDATAALDEESFRIVLTLTTADSVRALIATLLQPWITARTTAQQLDDVLSDHGLDSAINVGTESLTLLLADDELYSAVTFARLLGAPGLGADLKRHRRRGIRRLTERVQWLVTGVVGSPVTTDVEGACEHEVDRLTIEMSLEQARRLTQRLLLAEVADPTARLQRLLGKAVGLGAHVAWKPEDVSGPDRLTITMSPQQGRRLMNRLNPDQDATPAREPATH